MNGFLSPKGKFYECKNRMHCELATELIEQYNLDVNLRDEIYEFSDDNLKRHGFICFSDLVHVFMDREGNTVTDEQIEWVECNRDKISNKQYEYFMDYVILDEFERGE